MCHFITAFLPAGADTVALESVFRAHGRVLSLCIVAPIAPLGPGERCFNTTPGHCDCGTPLGEAHRAAVRAKDPESTSARLRRKGWSEAKIARAIAQRDDANRRERSRADRQTTLIEWCSLIKDALASGATSSLGLLLHVHSGDVVEIKARKVLRGGQVNEPVLAAIREDVLYEFRN